MILHLILQGAILRWPKGVNLKWRSWATSTWANGVNYRGFSTQDVKTKKEEKTEKREVRKEKKTDHEQSKLDKKQQKMDKKERKRDKMQRKLDKQG